MIFHIKITIYHKTSFSLLSLGQRVHSSLIKGARARQSVVVVIGYRVPISIAGGRLRHLEQTEMVQTTPISTQTLSAIKSNLQLSTGSQCKR